MNQPSLPTKTKIAALIMIGIGGIAGYFGLVGGIIRGINLRNEWAGYLILIGFGVFLGGLFLFSSGIFLLQRRKWAWWTSVIIITIELIAILYLTPTYSPRVREFEILSPYFNSFAVTILLLLSLLFLFLDRKASFFLDKPSLPLKTKVSALTMIIMSFTIGIFDLVRTSSVLISNLKLGNDFPTLFIAGFNTFLPYFLLLFLPGLSLFIKERGAFWFSIFAMILFYGRLFLIISAIGITFFISFFISGFFISGLDFLSRFIILIPLIAFAFLIFDYKNYLKICS